MILSDQVKSLDWKARETRFGCELPAETLQEVVAKLWLLLEGAFDPARVRRYLTNMTTKISSKGQIVLPAELRRRDRIKPGQRFDIERLESGKYLLEKSARQVPGGLVDWLLACPEKGWFRPIESESTDEI